MGKINRASRALIGNAATAPTAIVFAGRTAGGGVVESGPLGGFLLKTTDSQADAAMVLSNTALYGYTYTGAAVAIEGEWAKLFGIWADASENPLPGIEIPAAPKLWAEVSETGDAINLFFKNNLKPDPASDTIQRTIQGFGFGQTVHFKVVRDLTGYTVTLTVSGQDYVDFIPESSIADPWRYAADLVGGGDSYITQDAMQTRLLRMDVTPLALGEYHGTEAAAQHAYRSLQRSVRAPTAALARPWLSVGTNAYGGVWVWDNYFLGLTASHMNAEMRTLARNNLLNLLDHQGADGRVPRSIHADGAEEGVGNESQPWTAQTAVLLSRGDNDDWVDYQKVKRAVLWWENTRKTAAGLYQWLNRPESGFDNALSLGYPEASGADEYSAYTLGYESVSATALMSREWDALALLADKHEPGASAGYRAKAQAAREAINSNLWDEATGYYYSRDVKSGQLNKVLHMETGLFAVWAGAASTSRAERVLDRLALWARAHGVYTVAPEQPGFHADGNSTIGINWNGPNWVVFGYLLMQALAAQGRGADALAIAKNAASASALLRRRQTNSFHLPEAWDPSDATKIVGSTDFNGFGCVSAFGLPELADGCDPSALSWAPLGTPLRAAIAASSPAASPSTAQPPAQAITAPLASYFIESPNWPDIRPIDVPAVTWTRVQQNGKDFGGLTVPTLPPAPAGMRWQIAVSGFVHLYTTKAQGIFVGIQPIGEGMGYVRGGVLLSGGVRSLIPVQYEQPVFGGEKFYLSLYSYDAAGGGDTLRIDPNPRLRATIRLIYA